LTPTPFGNFKHHINGCIPLGQTETKCGKQVYTGTVLEQTQSVDILHYHICLVPSKTKQKIEHKKHL